MEHEPDASYALFGAEALLKRLQALTQEMDGVRLAQDIECVHQMRVASRRLRSALALFEECMPRKKLPDWQKRIRRITRALGAARDTDVQIDWLDETLRDLADARHKAGIERLRLRLRQRREQLQADVVHTLDQLVASRVAGEMEQTLRQDLVQARLGQVKTDSPYVYARAHAAIALRLEEFLAYETCVRRPEQVEELHAMRIAAKRLRYTLEVFAPLYEDNLKEPLKATREAQDVLGDIHDCDVWGQYLPQFMEEERARMLEYFGHVRPWGRLASGLLYLHRDRQQHRAERYQGFVEFWERTRERDVWGQLRRTLQSRLATPDGDPRIQLTRSEAGGAPQLSG
jgi:CHAD domain-containing protein